MGPRRLIAGLLAASAACCLSGCIGLGVGVLGNEEQTLEHPRISVDKGVVVASKSRTAWLAAEELRRHWGTPDGEERVSDGVERWQYNFGLRWNGVGVLVAFLPVPLMVPVGHEYIEFTIERGRVTSARTLEHTWIAMAGCLASAVPHAVGSDCIFEGRPKEPKCGSFSTCVAGQPMPADRVTVINATDGPVSVVHKDVYPKGKETRFVLEPRQSRTVLTQSYGKLSAADGAGRPIIPKGERFSYKQQADSTVVYLIAEGYIVPIPPGYWNDWEAHIRDIVDVKAEGRPDWAGLPDKSP